MATLAHAPSRPLTGSDPGTTRGSMRNLGPNWYASVMGTAIVANAGAVLPLDAPGLRGLYQAVWALSAVMLVVLVAARIVHWVRHTDQARAHLLDPMVAPFYGCLSMALLAVGGGTLSVGKDVIGVPAAAVADGVLWVLGTVIGIAAAAGVPYLMVTRHRIDLGTASPVWLLPVVAPMVSAALGPALVPHLPAGQWQATMVLGCYALFGASLLTVLALLPMVVSRLIHHGALPLPMTPTLFLVLGPLGQSTTAVSNLADAAPTALGDGYAGATAAFSVLYGVPVMGFALLWLLLATAMVVRAFRNGMKFAMTWWGFTFPVGTCVTGAAGLAHHTGLHLFTWLAVTLYLLLVAAWLTASTYTARGLRGGKLLAPPPAPSPKPAA